MPFLRFKIKFDEWLENGLFAFTTIAQGDIFPFVEGKIISVPLQFGTVEVGPFVYEKELSEATWIAELFADVEEVEIISFEGSFEEGEFIETSTSRSLSKVTRLTDQSIHTLEIPMDKDNLLITHLTEEDDPEFPFDESEKVVMPLRVTNLTKEAYDPMYNTFPLWTTLLVPVGKEVGTTIISEVKCLNKAV